MALKAAVFDIDGTLALMDKSRGTFTALPGAIAAIEACKAAGLAVVAYTNGTFFHPKHYYGPLSDAGIELDPGHMMTPAVVAAHELKRLGHRRIMVLAGEGTTGPLADAGLEVVAPESGAGPVDAVLVGMTREANVPMIEAAAEALWAGAPLFTTSYAPFFASSKGRMLGVSAVLAAGLEHASGGKATLFGKPSAAGLNMVADLTGAAPEDMVVIGDDPRLEIKMGRLGGTKAVGVLGGIGDRAAFDAAPETERAHVVLDTLEEFSLEQLESLA